MSSPVPPELAGERADKIVAVLAGVSRATARRLVEEGRATADGRVVEAKERLAENVLLEIEASAPAGLQPEDVPFLVRYEDEQVAVVDKPAGVVVHPGAGRAEGTLAAGLLARWPDLAGIGQEDRWGIVHRLDRETSGLLVVARTQPAYEALTRAMAARSVTRDYLAMAWGLFEVPTGTVDAPIGRDPRRPARMAVLSEGRRARTHFRQLAAWHRPGMSLLAVRLETGRTHQIRVHFASIGHPVVGDRVYGRPGPPGVDPERVWLHAHRLVFPHPVRGEPITVESPLPDELRSSFGTLGIPDDGDIESVS